MTLLKRLWQKIFGKPVPPESLSELSQKWREELERLERENERNKELEREWRVMG